MPASRLAIVLLFSFAFAGCTGEVEPPRRAAKTADEVLADSRSTLAQAEAVVALIKAGAALKSDGTEVVIEVDLRKATITDELLSTLATLQSVRTLNLSDTTFGDAQISTLEKINPQLTSLDLRGCALSDKATAAIARFTGLRALRFSGKSGKTTIGDDGLKALAACKSLKVLALDDLWIGTTGLEALTGLTELEELYLAGTVIDDSSIKLLAKFPKLKKLRLARTQVSDDALPTLSAQTTLEDLDLSENSLISNTGLTHVAKLTRLKKLNLWRVQISDEGIQQLAPLEQLEWLNLDNTKLSDAGLPVLKNMKALNFLHLGSTQITAAGASALFHLKGLKDLKITRTALASSESAVAELKANLPSTAIQTEYVEAEK